MDIFIGNFEKFLLIFARIAGFLFTATFFNSDSFIDEARLGLCFLISLVLFDSVSKLVPAVPSSYVEYALIAGGEAVIGVALGFIINIYFSVYQLAGQFFSVQMGLGASEVFDPMSQESLPVIGQFIYIIGILIFLAIRGPLLAINELYHSFELISFDKFITAGDNNFITSKYGLISTFSAMFLIALKISIPIIGTLLLVSISMGLLAKAAPQMNLLMVGFPISIMVSFLLILALIPSIVAFVYDYIDLVFNNIEYLFMEIKNG